MLYCSSKSNVFCYRGVNTVTVNSPQRTTGRGLPLVLVSGREESAQSVFTDRKQSVNDASSGSQSECRCNESASLDRQTECRTSGSLGSLWFWSGEIVSAVNLWTCFPGTQEPL